MSLNWSDIEEVVNELMDWQKKRLLREARDIIPYLTSDDILQPNDYPELENHPNFRYEEGILSGILTVQAALQAKKRGD